MSDHFDIPDHPTREWFQQASTSMLLAYGRKLRGKMQEELRQKQEKIVQLQRQLAAVNEVKAKPKENAEPPPIRCHAHVRVRMQDRYPLTTGHLPDVFRLPTHAQEDLGVAPRLRVISRAGPGDRYVGQGMPCGAIRVQQRGPP